MAVNAKILGRRRLIAAGDLRERVTVQLRTLSAPAADGVDAQLTLQDAKTVWAMVVTDGGSEFFDGTNLTHAWTHKFFVRYIPGTVFPRSGRMSAQERVTYKGRIFQVVDVENLEERDEFLLLKAVERGAADVAVNAA